MARTAQQYTSDLSDVFRVATKYYVATNPKQKTVKL